MFDFRHVVLGSIAVRSLRIDGSLEPRSDNEEERFLAMSFQTLGLHPSLLEALKGLGISRPSPLQKVALPPALDGRDIALTMARDGSTRDTAAYLLPVLDRLHRFTLEPGGEARVPRGLIVASADEAAGIAASAKAIAVPLGLTVADVAAVESPEDFDLLVATPASFSKGLARVLGKLRELVVDEADVLLSGEGSAAVSTWLAKLPAAGRRTTVVAQGEAPASALALLENAEVVALPTRRPRATAKSKVVAAPLDAEPQVETADESRVEAPAEVLAEPLAAMVPTLPIVPTVSTTAPEIEAAVELTEAEEPAAKPAPKKRTSKKKAAVVVEESGVEAASAEPAAVQFALPIAVVEPPSEQAPVAPVMSTPLPSVAVADSSAPLAVSSAPAAHTPHPPRPPKSEAPETPVSAAAMAIPQSVFEVSEELKPVLLAELIERAEVASAVAFLRTKHRANRLADFLARRGVPCDRIHGNRTPAQRHLAVQRFRDGKVKVLVATDVAARGLDLETLPCVVNFDLPVLADDYRNRIGRTAGSGSVIEALTFAAAEEANELAALERELGGTLPRRVLEGFDLDQAGEELEIPLFDRHNKPQPKAAPKPQAARPPRNGPHPHANKPHDRRNHERHAGPSNHQGQGQGPGHSQSAGPGGGPKPSRRKRTNKRGGGGGQPAQAPIPRGTFLPNGEFQPPPSLLPERPPSGIRGKRSISRF